MKLIRFIFVLICLISSIESKSAHLVGGEITYTCVGNNVYQIELIVYRDCNSTGAQLDNPASIGIFNGATGALVQNLQVNKGLTKSVPVNTGNPCLLAPPNVCTQYAEYSVLVSLPPSSQGYSIAYQRCCRNATITNINIPDDWGMTISARIPPNDNTCNNSPQWNNTPPIVLCSQENLSISSAAIDIDNDSLHYKLCEIYHGGGKSNQQGALNSPKPNPPGPPPYPVVPFNQSNTPANPIPGTPPISINGQTGIISGKLSVTGQYVVIICVEEWRNGMLLNTIRRDYQFNVTSCQASIWADIISEVDDPTQLCIGTTVPFSQNSFNSTFYHWDFGDPNISSDTSNLPNPTFTFNDTGVYTVTLIANPGWPCADTDQVDFHIYPPINANFQYLGDVCSDEQNFIFTPNGNWYPDKTIEWTFGTSLNDANIYKFSGEFPPPITFTQEGNYPVSLHIKSKACEETFIDTINVYDRPNIQNDFNGIIGCEPFTFLFDAKATSSTPLNYHWEFGDGNSSILDIPSHTYTKPGIYNVKLMAWTTTGCIDTINKNYPGAIVVNPRPIIPFSVSPLKVNIYKPEIAVSTSGIDPDEVFYFDMGDSTIYNQQDFFLHKYKDTGFFKIMRIAVNEFDCWDTLSQIVRVDPVMNIWSPNTFTPDGDNINDKFRPVVTGFNYYKLTILDRWGKIVFESNDPYEEWNGQIQNFGPQCPQGLYSWRLFILDFANSAIEKHGTILLYR
jgi:gliding motility-associated-like protein